MPTTAQACWREPSPLPIPNVARHFLPCIFVEAVVDLDLDLDLDLALALEALEASVAKPPCESSVHSG